MKHTRGTNSAQQKTKPASRLFAFMLTVLMLFGTVTAAFPTIAMAGDSTNSTGNTGASGNTSGSWYTTGYTFWKVSVYVSKSTNLYIDDYGDCSAYNYTMYAPELGDDWTLVGNRPFFIQRRCWDEKKEAAGKNASYDYSEGCVFVEQNKLQQRALGSEAARKNSLNANLRYTNNVWKYTDNAHDVPTVPINESEWGYSIEDVNAYFGYKPRLQYFLDFLGQKSGMTNGKLLVNSYYYTINGVTKTGAEWSSIGLKDSNGNSISIYPDADGRSAVSYLVIFEPILVYHIKSNYIPFTDKNGTQYTKLAFTATDLAIAYEDADSKYKPYYPSDNLRSVTFGLLPGSVYLEKDWFGLINDDYKFKDFPNSNNWETEVYRWNSVFYNGGYGMRHLGRKNLGQEDTAVTIEGLYDVDANKYVNTAVAGRTYKIKYQVHNNSRFSVIANSKYTVGGFLTDKTGSPKTLTAFDVEGTSDEAYVLTEAFTIPANTSITNLSVTASVNYDRRMLETNPNNNVATAYFSVLKNVKIYPTITVNLTNRTPDVENISGKRFEVYLITLKHYDSGSLVENEWVSVGNAAQYYYNGGYSYSNSEIYNKATPKTNYSYVGTITTDSSGQGTINLTSSTRKAFGTLFGDGIDLPTRYGEYFCAGGETVAAGARYDSSNRAYFVIRPIDNLTNTTSFYSVNKNTQKVNVFPSGYDIVFNYQWETEYTNYSALIANYHTTPVRETIYHDYAVVTLSGEDLHPSININIDTTKTGSIQVNVGKGVGYDLNILPTGGVAVTNPLKGRIISLVDARGDVHYAKTAASGQQGTCTFTNIPLGPYTVAANYRGDVDGDGRVTSSDARLILRAWGAFESFVPLQIEAANVANPTVTDKAKSESYYAALRMAANTVTYSDPKTLDVAGSNPVRKVSDLSEWPVSIYNAYDPVASYGHYYTPTIFSAPYSNRNYKYVSYIEGIAQDGIVDTHNFYICSDYTGTLKVSLARGTDLNSNDTLAGYSASLYRMGNDGTYSDLFATASTNSNGVAEFKPLVNSEYTENVPIGTYKIVFNQPTDTHVITKTAGYNASATKDEVSEIITIEVDDAINLTGKFYLQATGQIRVDLDKSAEAWSTFDCTNAANHLNFRLSHKGVISAPTTDDDTQITSFSTLDINDDNGYTLTAPSIDTCHKWVWKTGTDYNYTTSSNTTSGNYSNTYLKSLYPGETLYTGVLSSNAYVSERTAVLTPSCTATISGTVSYSGDTYTGVSKAINVILQGYVTGTSTWAAIKTKQANTSGSVVFNAADGVDIKNTAQYAKYRLVATSVTSTGVSSTQISSEVTVATLRGLHSVGHNQNLTLAFSGVNYGSITINLIHSVLNTTSCGANISGSFAIEGSANTGDQGIGKYQSTVSISSVAPSETGSKSITGLLPGTYTITKTNTTADHTHTSSPTAPTAYPVATVTVTSGGTATASFTETCAPKGNVLITFNHNSGTTFSCNKTVSPVFTIKNKTTGVVVQSGITFGAISVNGSDSRAYLLPVGTYTVSQVVSLTNHTVNESSIDVVVTTNNTTTAAFTAQCTYGNLTIQFDHNGSSEYNCQGTVAPIFTVTNKTTNEVVLANIAYSGVAVGASSSKTYLLPAGTYIVTRTTTPTNHSVNQDSQEITILANGTSTAVFNAECTYGKICVSFAHNGGSQYNCQSAVTPTFTITDKATGAVVKQITTFGAMGVGASKEATYLLPIGTYIVTQTATFPNHSTTTNTQEIVVTKNYTATAAFASQCTFGAISIKFSHNSDAEHISGDPECEVSLSPTFTVKGIDSNNSSITKTVSVSNVALDSDKTVVVSNLPAGRYRITMSTIDYHVVNSQSLEVEVVADEMENAEFSAACTSTIRGKIRVTYILDSGYENMGGLSASIVGKNSSNAVIMPSQTVTLIGNRWDANSAVYTSSTTVVSDLICYNSVNGNWKYTITPCAVENHAMTITGAPSSTEITILGEDIENCNDTVTGGTGENDGVYDIVVHYSLNVTDGNTAIGVIVSKADSAWKDTPEYSIVVSHGTSVLSYGAQTLTVEAITGEERTKAGFATVDYGVSVPSKKNFFVRSVNDVEGRLLPDIKCHAWTYVPQNGDKGWDYISAAKEETGVFRATLSSECTGSFEINIINGNDNESVQLQVCENDNVWTTVATKTATDASVTFSDITINGTVSGNIKYRAVIGETYTEEVSVDQFRAIAQHDGFGIHTVTKSLALSSIDVKLTAESSAWASVNSIRFGLYKASKNTNGIIGEYTKVTEKTTNSSGECSFEGLDMSSSVVYTVRPESTVNNHTFISTSFPGSSPATTLPFSGTASFNSGNNFTAYAGFTLRGTTGTITVNLAADAASWNKTISGQTVVLTGSNSSSVTKTTNASGVVTFTGIPLGSAYGTVSYTASVTSTCDCHTWSTATAISTATLRSATGLTATQTITKTTTHTGRISAKLNIVGDTTNASGVATGKVFALQGRVGTGSWVNIGTGTTNTTGLATINFAINGAVTYTEFRVVEPAIANYTYTSVPDKEFTIVQVRSHDICNGSVHIINPADLTKPASEPIPFEITPNPGSIRVQLVKDSSCWAGSVSNQTVRLYKNGVRITSDQTTTSEGVAIFSDISLTDANTTLYSVAVMNPYNCHTWSYSPVNVTVANIKAIANKTAVITATLSTNHTATITTKTTAKDGSNVAVGKAFTLYGGSSASGPWTSCGTATIGSNGTASFSGVSIFGNVAYTHYRIVAPTIDTYSYGSKGQERIITVTELREFIHCYSGIHQHNPDNSVSAPTTPEPIPFEISPNMGSIRVQLIKNGTAWANCLDAQTIRLYKNDVYVSGADQITTSGGIAVFDNIPLQDANTTKYTMVVDNAHACHTWSYSPVSVTVGTLKAATGYTTTLTATLSTPHTGSISVKLQTSGQISGTSIIPSADAAAIANKIFILQGKESGGNWTAISTSTTNSLGVATFAFAINGTVTYNDFRLVEPTIANYHYVDFDANDFAFTIAEIRNPALCDNGIHKINPAALTAPATEPIVIEIAPDTGNLNIKLSHIGTCSDIANGTFTVTGNGYSKTGISIANVNTGDMGVAPALTLPVGNYRVTMTNTVDEHTHEPTEKYIDVVIGKHGEVDALFSVQGEAPKGKVTVSLTQVITPPTYYTTEWESLVYGKTYTAMLWPVSGSPLDAQTVQFTTTKGVNNQSLVFDEIDDGEYYVALSGTYADMYISFNNNIGTTATQISHTSAGETVNFKVGNYTHTVTLKYDNDFHENFSSARFAITNGSVANSNMSVNANGIKTILVPGASVRGNNATYTFSQTAAPANYTIETRTPSISVPNTQNSTHTIEIDNSPYGRPVNDDEIYNELIWDFAVSKNQSTVTVKRGQPINFSALYTNKRGAGATPKEAEPTVIVYIKSTSNTLYNAKITMTGNNINTFTGNYSRISSDIPEGTYNVYFYINQDGKYLETNYSDNVDKMTLVVTPPESDISITAFSHPAVCPGLQVITSFKVVNTGFVPVTPDKNVSVSATITYTATGGVTKTLTTDNITGSMAPLVKNNIVCPHSGLYGDAAMNLVWFKWKVPSDAIGSSITVTATLSATSIVGDNAANNVATATHTLGNYYASDTPNPGNNLNAPTSWRSSIPLMTNDDLFSTASTTGAWSDTKMDQAVWDEWKYDDTNGFYARRNTVSLNVTAYVKADVRNLTAQLVGNNLQTRSGYALTLAAMPTINRSCDADAYTGVQLFRAAYAERGFSLAANNHTTLQEVSSTKGNLALSQFTATDVGTTTAHRNVILGNQTRWELPYCTHSSYYTNASNPGMTRKHFVPLWWHNASPYYIAVRADFLFTPVGSMRTAAMATTKDGGRVGVEGSVYDDYYTSRG